MKNLILVVALVMFGASSFATETKKTCIEQKDPKTGKMKEVCKEVKIHKKLEVEATPDKKAK
jgi:hypothetical protein